MRGGGPTRWIVVRPGRPYRCAVCKVALPPGAKAVYAQKGIYCPDHRPAGRIEGVGPEVKA